MLWDCFVAEPLYFQMKIEVVTETQNQCSAVTSSGFQTSLSADIQEAQS